MDIWKELCFKAFNGEEAANHLILYLEGCGKLTGTGFTVTKSALSNDDRALLEQMGFIQQEDEYTLPGDQWPTFLETKRTTRVEWHEQRQRELRQQLNDTLKQVPVLGGVNEQQRVAIVTEFARRFATDAGVIPFMRGLVGFLRFQLFKDQLADWQCYEYVLTQNGQEVMVEYVRLLQGVLGFHLVSKQEQEQQVVISIEAADQDDPILTWRMSELLSDHALSDILSVLPKDQAVSGYKLSGIARPVRLSPTMALHHPQYLVQWIRHLLLHCFSFIRK
ncbi:hypothetical protein BJV82DRAFT_621615 [Fennellomyces sp. T-0311]|nr:hypothetical protein BJV82DRAFT_621615 [Fennellomyces sp. T-0311]